MSTIFISHSSSDKKYIKKFRELFKKTQYNPWYSEEEIQPGQNWDDAVTQAVVQSDFLIVILSEGVSKKSDQVSNELDFAEKSNKVLLIYVIGEIENDDAIKKILCRFGRKQRKNYDSFATFIDSFDSNIVDDIKRIYGWLYPEEQDLKELTKKVKKDFSSIEYFKGKFTLFSIQSILPVPEYMGNWQFNDDEKYKYKDAVEKFNNDLKTAKFLNNEPHALMSFNEDVFSASNLSNIKQLPYYSTNYIGVRLLRELGYKPKIISAGAITISPIEKKLYFQQRGDQVATYKKHFHILGGNYIGERNEELDLNITHPDNTLSSTINREIKEESSISLSQESCETGIYSIGMEDDTGFIQVEAHALSLLSKQQIINGNNKAKVRANWEGGIYGIGFDSLEDFLKYSYKWWVPSGFAHVMIWLALDAPFAAEVNNGKEIYESVLNHIRTQEKDA